MKITLFKSALTVMLMTVLALGQANAANFYLILVKDASVMSAATDLASISALSNQVCSSTQMSLIRKEFIKSDRALVTYLNSLSLASDDVVWFHYTGHGCNSGNGWPTFLTNANPNEGISSTDVRTLLEQKGGRFRLITYDCCNIGSNNQNEARTGNYPSISNATYNKLFKKARGTVMVAGAETGRLGWGTSDAGGVFTNSFVRAIQDVDVSNSSNPWNTVENKVQSNMVTNAAKINKTQQSKWSLNVNYNGNDSNYNTPEYQRPTRSALSGK